MVSCTLGSMAMNKQPPRIVSNVTTPVGTNPVYPYPPGPMALQGQVVGTPPAAFVQPVPALQPMPMMPVAAQVPGRMVPQPPAGKPTLVHATAQPSMVIPTAQPLQPQQAAPAQVRQAALTTAA